MWAIVRQSLVTNPEADDLTGISDLDLVPFEGNLFLYAQTRTSQGITVFAIDLVTGGLTQIDRETIPMESGFPATGAEIVTIGGETIIVPIGRNSTPIN